VCCVCGCVCVLCVSAEAQTSASAQIHAQISAQTFRSVQMIRSVCVGVWVPVCVVQKSNQCAFRVQPQRCSGWLCTSDLEFGVVFFLSLSSEIFRIWKLKFNYIFHRNGYPNMGPFSGPESGQPKRGTHSAYPFWAVHILGRKTAPYLGSRAVRKFGTAFCFFSHERFFFASCTGP
jgi:hypothetical protein